MEKKYFYFQPQYVSKFKCDGAKCDAHCCRDWNIFIDAKTYEEYSKLNSAQEIISRIKFNADKGEHVFVLNEKRRCPFLNENKLCRLQLKYGEKFLSQTCATYPRITNNVGYFFERSLILSCPVAAEIILFEREPLKFEFVQVPEKIHSLDGKLFFQQIQTTEELRTHLIEIQIAMISILQERTLTLDQRLIVLGFFVDRLEEIFLDFDEDALTKLIAAYESKKFLAGKVPLMIQSVAFDAEKFADVIQKLFNRLYDAEDYFDSARDKKYFGAFVDLFKINFDFAANYKKLADVRKNFWENYSTFLENYLVNEIFLSIYPWRFEGSFIQNFIAFAAEYKFFELIIFAATIKGLNDKENLLEATSWFVTRFDHVNEYKQRIFDYFKDKDEPFSLMESLLEGSDLN